MPLQFLAARDQVPYATGIYPEDRYPEEKTHNHAKYIYGPYLVVPRPARIVKYAGRNACGLVARIDIGYHNVVTAEMWGAQAAGVLD